MADKSKEQLFEKLPKEPKAPEGKTNTQNQMIRKFQMLMTGGSLSSQIADYLPYPIAIFTPRHTLAMVNRAFWEETKTGPIDLKKRVVRILKYRIDDAQLAAAVTKVFAGETFFLEDLKNPFSMFSEIIRNKGQLSERFNKALVFPVTAHGTDITHGVIVLMP